MKKTENKDKNKKLLAVGGLSALCIAVLVGAYFLTREPENDFVPASTQTVDTTDTWDENADTPVTTPSSTEGNVSQVTGTASDPIQNIVSEDESGTVSSLSNSTQKEDTSSEQPTEKPVTTDDTTNPDKQPEYDDTVPQVSPPNDAPDTTPPADGGSDSGSHPGQVYDPVFGWIDTGNTSQDTVDSDGDINTQIGTMN